MRTHYDNNGTADEKLSEWLERDKEQDMLYGFGEEWWRIPSDRALFDSGDEWQQIFHTLPELVDRCSNEGHQKRIDPAWSAEARNAEDFVDELQFLSYVGQPPLLVADRDAFEKDVLHLMFLDGYGNVVRYSEVKAENKAWLKQALERGQLHSSDWWRNGETGELYEPDAEIGRLLYSEVDWE